MRAPAPARQPLVGHLGRWGLSPLALLQEGARLGPVFELRLWRRAVVGYNQEWNRAVLGDLDTFRSKGSLSALSPYLNSGVVQTDPPEHRPQRRALNPSFTRGALAALRDQIAAVVEEHLPDGPFDTVEWSATLMRAVLSRTFLGTPGTDPVLNRWLGPMEKPLPQPFLPRPLRFRALDARLTRALADPPAGTLAATFAAHGGLPEMRVGLAAGYDTTAHTLAWLLAHAAQDPSLMSPARHEAAINETLRLYPAGWTGSRRTHRDTTVAGIDLPEGTLVLYSPFLTHRDPALWPDPTAYRPERADDGVPPWGFIPFAAGERTCLGRHYALLVLRTVLEVLGEHTLRFDGGDLTPLAGVTLRPTGPLRVHLSRRTMPATTISPASHHTPLGGTP